MSEGWLGITRWPSPCQSMQEHGGQAGGVQARTSPVHLGGGQSMHAGNRARLEGLGRAQRGVHADQGSGLYRQGDAVRQRVPVPVLREQRQAQHSGAPARMGGWWAVREEVGSFN